MALLVEIHVPMTADGEWIDDVGDFMIDLEEELGLEEYDDGEEFGDVYLFFIAGARKERCWRRPPGWRPGPACRPAPSPW
jgi:hypothetical protein